LFAPENVSGDRPLCAIGWALFGLVALGEMAVRRWFGGVMPVEGVI